MKNLKRVLSLVLATVMVIGMMVVGASAADYKDADKIDYAEAVDVMSAVGMIEGYDGNFAPEATIDRAGATKLITYLMLGTDVAKKLTVTEAPFEDVPATAWYAPFVAFCADKGLLEGYNGKFYPNETINAYGFAKLLLGALGYDATIEGMTGDTWQVNVATLAIKNGLFNGNDGAFANEAMTREEACLYAFNALKATMVDYQTKGSNITVDGIIINTGASKAEPVVILSETNNYDVRTGGVAVGAGTKQLCEALYTKLTLNNGDEDSFGRPSAYQWKLGTDSVYASSEKATFTYTTLNSESDIAKALKGYTFNGTKLVDTNTRIGAKYDEAIGDLTFDARNTKIAYTISELTENGTLVEIYADNDKAVYDVVVVTYAVETIDNVATAKNGNVTYTLSVTGAVVDYADDDTYTDEVVLYGEFVKGDVVTTVTDNDSITHVYPTTMITGAQTATKTDSTTSVQTITVGGTKYVVGENAIGSYTNNNTAAKYFIDQYGFVVMTDSISTTYTNYAQLKGFITSLDTTIDGSTPSVSARFMLANGTVAVYDVALTKNTGSHQYELLGTKVFDYEASPAESAYDVQSAVEGILNEGDVFAYSLKDNTISLQEVDTVWANDELMQGNPENDIHTGDTFAAVEDTAGSPVTLKALLDKDTVYVLYDAVKKTATAYTGALPANATLDTASTVIVALTNNNSSRGTAKVVFGVSNIGTAATGDYAYIDHTDYTVELNADDEVYRVYEGVMADGTTITVYDDDSAPVVTDSKLYTWDDDMFVSEAYAATGVVNVKNTYFVENNQMINAAGSRVFNMDNAEIVYVDATKTSVDGSSCIVVREVVNGSSTNNAAVIFVVG